MDDKLTQEELNILIDAADAWINAGEASFAMGEIMGTMLGSQDPTLKDKIKKDMVFEREKHNQQKEYRKRTATIIKAKLILAQQKMMDSSSGISISDLIKE